MEAQGLVKHIVGESEAQKMRTPSGKLMAYNIQSAVDAEHCLILHHEMTQDGADRHQLEAMAKAAKAELQQPQLSVTVDAGYSNSEQFQACEDAGITAFVPLIGRLTIKVETLSFSIVRTSNTRRTATVINALPASF